MPNGAGQPPIWATRTPWRVTATSSSVPAASSAAAPATPIQDRGTRYASSAQVSKPNPITIAVRIKACGRGLAVAPWATSGATGSRAGRPRVRPPLVKIRRLTALLIRTSPNSSRSRFLRSIRYTPPATSPPVSTASTSSMGSRLLLEREHQGQHRADDHEVHAEIEHQRRAQPDAVLGRCPAERRPQTAQERLTRERRRHPGEQGEADPGKRDGARAGAQGAPDLARAMGDRVQDEGDRRDQAADEAAARRVVAAQQEEHREHEDQADEEPARGAQDERAGRADRPCAARPDQRESGQTRDSEHGNLAEG